VTLPAVISNVEVTAAPGDRLIGFGETLALNPDAGMFATLNETGPLKAPIEVIVIVVEVLESSTIPTIWLPVMVKSLGSAVIAMVNVKVWDGPLGGDVPETVMLAPEVTGASSAT
jgi:hypothetical protein